MNIWKYVAALIAGALASIVGGLYFQVWTPHKNTAWMWVIIILVLVIVLIIYVSGIFSKIWYRLCLWWRQRKTLIGILNDAGEIKEGINSSCTHISLSDWKKEVEQAAQADSRKVKVRFITTRNNFVRYRAILNPYGGAYPEPNASKLDTLDKILEYVNEGGLFVNVADLPGYWAYNSRVNRIFETPQQTFVPGHAQPDYFFSLVPFTQRMGLTVLNTQIAPLRDWNGEFEERFGIIGTHNLRVDRAVVIERNVEPIIQPKPLDSKRFTPVFLANYGYGQCLISLPFLDNSINNQHDQGNYMKEKLVKILLNIVCNKE